MTYAITTIEAGATVSCVAEFATLDAALGYIESLGDVLDVEEDEDFPGHYDAAVSVRGSLQTYASNPA